VGCRCLPDFGVLPDLIAQIKESAHIMLQSSVAMYDAMDRIRADDWSNRQIKMTADVYPGSLIGMVTSYGDIFWRW
jgi:hypothetical protein